MNAFSATMVSLREEAGRFGAEPGEEWRQGRTLFGGISAALALEATRHAFPDLPSLRSAQFTFAGPAEGALWLEPKLLRMGRTAAFVSVSATTALGIAMHALLSFGAARPSAVEYIGLPAPTVLMPDRCPPFFIEAFAPRSTQQFDGRLAGGARPVSSAERPEFLIWLRHRDERAPDGAMSLIALADAPPPGAMTLFQNPAPISTMTWSVDVLATAFSGADWHLARMTAEVASGGYSSQSMTLWDSLARPVLTSRQTVAIYA
jgi:acyl-CoA thioesterase